MKKLNSIVISLNIILIFSFGCGKPSSINEIKYYSISDKFKEYSLFQSGSMWVYQNELSGILDTVIVDSIDTYIGYYGLDEYKNEIYKYEAIDIFLLSDTNINYEKLELSGNNSTVGENGMNEVFRLYENADYRRVFAPEQDIGVIYNYGGRTGYYQNVEFLNSYSISGHTFNNVFHSKLIDSTNINEIINYHYYIAKNYGIIRQEKYQNNDSIIWNLHDWEIIQ